MSNIRYSIMHHNGQFIQPILFGLLVFLFVHGGNAADSPQVISIHPSQNHTHASDDSIVSATFSENMQGGNSNTFTVHGSQSGKLSGIYAGGFSPSLSFDPATNFKPGERINVTLTTGLQSSESIALPTPYAWQFSAASSGTGEGYFGGINYKFGTGMDYTHANVRLGDMDNDSDLDIVIGNHSEQNVVYINQGNGVFSSVLFGPSNDTTEDLDIGDFNNDGFLDIIVGNGSGFPNVLYLNNGNNVYNSFCSFSSRTNSISAGDVNGDGYIDVLITKYRSQGMPLRYLVWAEGKTSGK